MSRKGVDLFRSPSKLEFLTARERFIPVQVPALVERIACDPELSPEERKNFVMLACLLQARFHFEFLEYSDILNRLFDPFYCDRDTLPLRNLKPEEYDQWFEEFRRHLDYILIRSNYTKLSREELVRCLEAENPWGIRVIVDLSRFKHIDFYYRGVRERTEPYKRWYSPVTLWRRRWQFARLAVLVRLEDRHVRKLDGAPAAPGDTVLVRLFKDVFLEELKMTAPEIRIRIRLLDKIQIFVSLISAVVTSFMRLIVAAALNPILFFSVLSGCIMAAVAAVRNFITCRIRYLERLGANLYNKLVASDHAAIARLLITAEAEEVKEALLAYYMLYKHRDKELTAEEVDQLVQKWLADQFALDFVDFEIEDGLRKLAEKDLLVVREVPLHHRPRQEVGGGDQTLPGQPPGPILAPTDAGEEAIGACSTAAPAGTRVIYKVFNLPSALRRLDEWWDNYFLYANVGRPEKDRVANHSTA